MNKLEKYPDLDLTTPFKSKEDIEELLQTALEDYQQTGDKGMFLAGLKLASESLEKINGVNNLAKKTGLNRQHLYKMLAPKGNPTFENIAKIITCLGYELQIKKHTENHIR